MRFLITGGAGFIGSHLAERLLGRGDHVVLLDNLSTGSVENIRHLKTHERLQHHFDNIENRQLVAELVDDADVVVHLAAAVGVKLIVESPVRTIETNVNGTQMILEAACKKRKLVLTASIGGLRQKYQRAVPRGRRPRPGAPPPRAAGAMRHRKPSMNFSRSRIGKRKNCRSLWCVCSIPWVGGKPAATAWCCPTS